MGAINLLINRNLMSYEIRNNVIILKENDTIVYEFPIPRGYYLLGEIDRDVHGIQEKRFVIANYKLNQPLWVPTGFGNPYLSDSGVWQIEEINKTDTRKILEYIDTSVLTLEDFYDVYYGNKRATELFENGFKIPKSFWYSKTYHYDNYSMERRIRNIPNYMKNYDKRARLIREDEAMALVALNFSMSLRKGKDKNLYSYCDRAVGQKYGIECRGHIPDNWPILVSSLENTNVYRTLSPSEAYLCDNTHASNACVTLSNNEPYPYLIFPVIEEEINQKRILKNN